MDSMVLPVAAIVLLNGSVAASLLLGNIFSMKKICCNSSKVQDKKKDSLWMKSPLKCSDWLSKSLGKEDSVKLKMETMQPTGSPKIRGISECMQQNYNNNKKIDTFVTSSCGNAGMAVAYAAEQMKCNCKVILDYSQRDNPMIEVLTEMYGANVEFAGSTWEEADEYAMELCDQSPQMEYVNTFDDPIIWNGYSTIITELEEQCDSPPDAIVCALGGGQLLMGVFGGLYKNRWSRRTKVIAAQSENYALLEAAKKNSYEPAIKKCVSPEGVDLGHRSVPRAVTEMVLKFESFNPVKSLVVRDQDVLNTATLFGRTEHAIIEPQYAVAVTAVLKNKEYFKQFKNIVVIVGGGNRIHFDLDGLRKAQANGEWNLQDYDDKTYKSDTADMSYLSEDLLNYTFYDSDTEEM